jgi:dihydroorotate dehydrogenase
LDHPGGISGKLLVKNSNEIIKYIRQSTKGKLKIIGLGGVFTAQDAYEKIKLGADLIQMITGFIYNGPLAVKHINLGLIKLLQKDGFKNISEAVGKNVS